MTSSSISPARRMCMSILSLLVAGCSLFENGDSSQVQLSIQGHTDVLRRAIKVELSAPGWGKTLTGSDFGTADAPTLTEAFETPGAGTLQVLFFLRDSTGGHLNSGSVALDIRPDWRWGIDLVLSDKNPFYGCFGCTGFKVIALDSLYQTTPKDSLFVVWGGNSIKHPVVY